MYELLTDCREFPYGKHSVFAIPFLPCFGPPLCNIHIHAHMHNGATGAVAVGIMMGCRGSADVEDEAGEGGAAFGPACVQACVWQAWAWQAWGAVLVCVCLCACSHACVCVCRCGWAGGCGELSVSGKGMKHGLGGNPWR